MRNFKKLLLNSLVIGVILLAMGCEDAKETAKKVTKNVEEKIQSEATKDNKYLRSVKSGTLNGYPNIKIDDAFANFFLSPTWKYFEDKTGKHVVEFTGYCTYMEKKVKAKLQFLVKEGKGSFEVGALEFNDVPQNNLTKVALIKAIYEDTQDEGNKVEQPKNTTSNSSINLKNFVKWSYGDSDKMIPVSFDGEQDNIILGLDTPNGVKTQILINSISTAFNLPLELDSDSTPFDEYGDLLEGFNLYATGYDFDLDGTDEVVIAVSDGSLETYFWIFSYNFVATENGDNPLKVIFHGEGQADLELEGNTITVPYGSQGLFDKYIYSNSKFVKQ